MGDINSIKERLDTIYEEYRKQNSKLSQTKTQEVSNLLVQMSLIDGIDITDIAKQLARFSAEVTQSYFEKLTARSSISLERIDDLLKAFLSTDRDVNKSQYYVSKFVFTVSEIIKNCREKALQSTQLPKMVVFVTRFAVNSDKYKKKFQNLVVNTDGKIYLLDYHGTSGKSLYNIWGITNKLYPDLSKTKYKNLIIEWAEKYGFKEKAEQPAENITEKSDEPVNTAEISNTNDVQAETDYISKEFFEKKLNALYSRIKEDITSENRKIISSLQEATTRNTGLVSENSRLNLKVRELEVKIKELNFDIQETSKNLFRITSEKNALDEKTSELEAKLKDAYAINNREESLAVQKIRMDLKKSLMFLYEDWLEYEFSDVSEENYESLQAIIKKMFRVLERNGIDFKEN